ncbi:WD40-repeat-containing domain protein [Entophlyctis helioformis]|nr:WD40-repeat-containing domain protein [Entophlyctis helioformis]
MKRSAPAAGLSLPPRKSHPLRSFFLGTEPAPALSPALSPTQPAAASPAASAPDDKPASAASYSHSSHTNSYDNSSQQRQRARHRLGLHLLPSIPVGVTVSDSAQSSVSESVLASIAAPPLPAPFLHSDAAPYVPLPESAQDHIFRNLRLRRIVKENHGSEIQHCVFFTPPPTDDEAGGGRGPAAGTDASNVLATIAGGDKLIHILSLATSSEIKILAGHEGKIMDLQAHPLDDNLLLSCSTDGTARLWHLDSGRCVCTYAVHATALSFHPSGQSFVTGSFSGSIDCIRFVGDCVLSKSTSGKMALWDAESKQTIHSFHLRGGSNRCRFDVTYVCVGTAVGTVSVYSLVTGRLISELRHKRSNKAVRCCAFSRHQRNIVFAGEDSFIWRFDYRPADSESVSR